MSETAVVWFRTDLRVRDNETLAAAAGADEVVPLYVFDPRAFDPEGGMFGLPKTGPHRARFLRESVVDLRASLRERGGDLLVREGRPEAVVPDVAGRVGADVVHFQTLPAPDERRVEDAVETQLDEEGIHHRRHWTHTLYHVDDLPRDVDRIDDTFTPFKDRTEALAEPRDPVGDPGRIDTPAAPHRGSIPSVAALGVPDPDAEPDDRGVLPFEGGETAGRERVDAYLWEGDHLREYRATRNGLLGANYSSKLSPWLAHGCLSPRWINAEVERYEAERVANEDTYWLVFELTWRDFFQFQFRKHGADFFRPSGIRGIDRAWSGGEERFRRWADGETGVPFVDANVRELNETGYMSNRGRQNVASFLADWLDVDWRRGAAYFESTLVDYDVCSNWGNWAYQAGVGNDSRNRYFDVVSQAERYDPDGEYVRHWLPELSGVPADAVHRPWVLSADQQDVFGCRLGADYPRPVIDVDARRAALERER